jgi:polyhydroxyalkanoate synthesis regulator phasin
MRDDVRKLVGGALDKLTPAKAQELARSIAKGEGREQVSKLAHELLEWSSRNRDKLAALVRREVKEQLKALGVATKDEVEALRKRVRALESGSKPRSRATTAKRTSKRQPAKRATGRE